jgi:hypothetical protein
VLLIAGDHVPVILLSDVVFNTIEPPLQIGATCVNVGVIGWLTVTVIGAVVAHCPTPGVKVYVVVAVLLTAGDHVPVIALFDVVGREIVPPLQIGATCVNVGVIGWLTVTVIVVVVAHRPAVGVNVYVVVAVLLIAGDHVPVIPFVEVVGRVIVPPLHTGATCVNVGVTFGLTVTDIVAVVAHCPAVGVNVYVVVDVLFTAGSHEPVIPFVEVVFNVNDPPLQIGPTCAKLGVVWALTVIVIVTVVAHCPAVGVKV